MAARRLTILSDYSELPCGIVINMTRGECCKTVCPYEWKRECNTKDPLNPIERCYHRLDYYRLKGMSIEERKRKAKKLGIKRISKDTKSKNGGDNK